MSFFTAREYPPPLPPKSPIERRLDRIEAKLDELLRLLAQQKRQ